MNDPALHVEDYKLKDNREHLEHPSSRRLVIEFTRVPQADSLKQALAFLSTVARTLVEKERGYGNVADHVKVFAHVSPEERIRTRIDEKLTRISRLGTAEESDEDTLMDLVGYLALLAGLRTRKEESK